MSTSNNVVDHDSMSKTSYDEKCAQLCFESVELRNKIAEKVQDPSQVDDILNLINSHQSTSVTPVTLGHNDFGIKMLPISWAGMNNQSMPPQLPPLPHSSFMPNPFPPAARSSMPLFIQPRSSQGDSGFYSNSSAPGEEESAICPFGDNVYGGAMPDFLPAYDLIDDVTSQAWHDPEWMLPTTSNASQA
ncbi:hypothetical protein G7Y89_g11009 [Cudoniella acicularis]|uniref:Uncharacterized protein n=1 Tax=Cudoniella acicularis TaxID=354080 RepID=A0A8H4VYN8_9HELO|nr:hypothetical protein G7Y89_g11009 [Cudoniella acicularis]